MPLSIKNEETERLARQVAQQAGESLTEAIQVSLKERLQRLQTIQRAKVIKSQIEDILRHLDELPTIDTRMDDEILGYDANGLPR